MCKCGRVFRYVRGWHWGKRWSGQKGCGNYSKCNNCFGCSTVALISRFREHISVCAFETHQFSFSSWVYFHPPSPSNPLLFPFPLRVKTLLILLCYDLVTHTAYFYSTYPLVHLAFRIQDFPVSFILIFRMLVAKKK